MALVLSINFTEISALTQSSFPLYILLCICILNFIMYLLTVMHKETFEEKQVYFLSMEYCHVGNVLPVVLLTFCLFSLNSWIFAFSMNCQMILHELWNNYILYINTLSDDDYKYFMMNLKYSAVLRNNYYRISQH